VAAVVVAVAVARQPDPARRGVADPVRPDAEYSCHMNTLRLRIAAMRRR
jgi:hypothetical protein